MGCGGCTTTSRSSVGFRGPSALATSLVQLSEQGFSDFDLRDDAGELSVRLGLEELVPLLRKGPMPETLPVVALPSSAMPRLGRIVISAVAAPLILVSVMVALIPVMLVLLPLGLVLAPVALLLVPAICSGMRSDWSRQARGIVTEFPVRAEDEQEAEDEEDDDEEDDRYRVRISMPSPEPVRMRVRVSSASGVFSRKIVALTDDDLASVDTEAADEAASAHVA